MLLPAKTFRYDHQQNEQHQDRCRISTKTAVTISSNYFAHSILLLELRYNVLYGLVRTW